MKRHLRVMADDGLFSYPVERRHVVVSLPYRAKACPRKKKAPATKPELRRGRRGREDGDAGRMPRCHRACYGDTHSPRFVKHGFSDSVDSFSANFPPESPGMAVFLPAATRSLAECRTRKGMFPSSSFRQSPLIWRKENSGSWFECDEASRLAQMFSKAPIRF